MDICDQLLMPHISAKHLNEKSKLRLQYLIWKTVSLNDHDNQLLFFIS